MVIPLEQVNQPPRPLLPDEDAPTVRPAHYVLAVGPEEADALDCLRVAVAPVALHLAEIWRRVLFCVAPSLRWTSPANQMRG